MSTLSADSVDVRIDRWRRNLVDTSLRNRLLDVKESRLGCLRLTSPSLQELYGTLAAAGDAMNVEMGPNGTASCLTPGSSPPCPPEKGRVDRSLMLMRTKAREALREQGVNILYITLGVLEWRPDSTSDQAVRSPLLLLPVTLSRVGPLDPYVIRSCGPLSPNPTLMYKLHSELKLALPSPGPGPADVPRYLDSVRASFHRLGWEVEDTAFLGLFKFPKMCMFEELELHREEIAAHPVVRALCGLGAPDAPHLLPLRPGGAFQVVDADSSQQEAIDLALSGQSFVLQGPPGTGKSQTITNIIAEVISHGRKVLFVSEKMAALEVVEKRLHAHGMGDYCLELHAHDAPRQMVVDELLRCLSRPPVAEAATAGGEDLTRARDILDGYVDALHCRREGVSSSYYQVLEGLIEVRDAGDLPITLPNLERTGWVDLEHLKPLVQEVERYRPLLADPSFHPWSDCLLDSRTLGAQTDVSYRLTTMKLAAARLIEAVDQFCKELEMKAPDTLRGVEDLVDHLRMICQTTYPDERWLAQDPTPLLDLLDNIKESYLKLGDRMTWLRQMYREDVLALDIHAMQRRMDTDYRSAFRRLVNFHYRRDMGTLRSLYRGERKLSFDAAQGDVHEIVSISDQVTALHALETECGERLGKRFQGESTNWEKTRADIEWTVEYYRRYGSPTSPGIIRLLCSGPDALTGLNTKVDGLEDVSIDLERTFVSISETFDLAMLTAGRTAGEVPMPELIAWAQGHLDTQDKFHEWTEVSRVRREVKEHGLGDLLVLAEQGTLPASGLWDRLRKRYLTLWHDLLLSRDRRLREFDRDGQDRTVERFSELDRRSIEIASLKARSSLDARWRRLVEASPENGNGLWVLKHEVSRKRNGRPLRELFSLAAEPIQALKPCLLMSPLSVSTFLDPSKVSFDVVIFDEASQVRPEDAIGSIMRAKQVIVVGDSRQLPPTDFFREVNDEDEDIPDLESILDETASAMPQRMLRWHYRSRQESLIAFSNRRFYGNRLVTFPSAAVDRDGLGVAFVHVPEGRYDRARSRKNVKEAEMVAGLVIEHVTHCPGQSLGVVAFSEPQQMAIIEELERLVAKEPSLAPLLSEEGDEGFFVKNLENVQGDERDVMIFSVGYGRDEQGRMVQNFGPLNKAGGERRLNVAITRARMHVKLVSSMLPEDIEGLTPGASSLREYIAYAQTPHRGPALDEPIARTPLEAEVKAWLEERGLVVEQRIGRSEAKVDLAVADRNRPGNYVLGILTDGPSYFHAGGTRDRERLREEVLTGLGWTIHRLWSQEWIRDQEREGERILAALDRARAAAAERALAGQDMARVELHDHDHEARALEAVDEPDELAVATIDDVADEVTPPVDRARAKNEITPSAQAAAITEGVPAEGMAARAGVIPYQVTVLRRGHHLVSHYKQDPEGASRDAVKLVVEQEGPVHISVVKERLKSLVAAAAVKRSANIETIANDAIRYLEGASVIRVDGEFLWPAEMSDVPVRACDGFRRDVYCVCEEEIETMIMALVPEDRPADIKDVVKDVSLLLGYKRPTPAIKSRVEQAVTSLGDKGSVDSEDEDPDGVEADDEGGPSGEEA